MIIESINNTTTASRPVEIVNAEVLRSLQAGFDLQLDHYGGKRLPFGCISAQGINQTLVKLMEPDRGQVFHTLDASGGYASACLGASSLVICESMNRAIRSAGYVTDEIAALERGRLLNYLFGPSGLWSEQFKFNNYHISGRSSGSEGLELALRLAYESRMQSTNLSVVTKRSQRNRILAFEGAWHGWTSGLLPLINRRHFNYRLPKVDPNDAAGVGIDFLPFGEVAALEEFFKNHGTALLAVVVEPIQGDAGILLPPEGYLRRLAALCKQYEVILIADEVLTFAKTGKFFAMCDAEGPIETDITVIGKSLGMGVLPISMVIARREFTVRSCGAVATSDLRPITSAVIKDGIEYIVRENLLEKSALFGAELRTKLHMELVQGFPQVYKEVRGTGYLNGVEVTEEFSSRAPELREALIKNGVYVEFMAGAGKRSRGLRYLFPTMRIAPPLTTTEQQLDEIILRIVAGIKELIANE